MSFDRAEYQRQYRATPKGRAAIKKYNRSKSARQAVKKYRDGPENKEKAYNNTKNYRARNIQKRQCQSKLTNAVRDNKIVRPTTCECCGSVCETQAHHWDYSQPFCVRWLEKDCHIELHNWARDFKEYYLSLGE